MTVTTSCNNWAPPTAVLQTGRGNEVTVVDAAALRSQWPVLPHAYGTHFAVKTVCKSVRSRSVPLSLYDQGRDVCGVYHGMGVGVKVTAPRGTTSTEVVAKKGTRLLCFVVVARTTASAEEAVALCRAHDIGGERGYGVLRDGSQVLVYDVARSAAWFVNAAHGTRSWFAGKRPVANLALRVCHRAGHRWTACFAATRELRLGDALFAPYGVGSSHHEAIAADAAARLGREPACNKRKRARREQLAQARTRRRHLS